MLYQKFSQLFLLIALITSFGIYPTSQELIQNTETPREKNLKDAHYRVKAWKNFVQQILGTGLVHYTGQTYPNALDYFKPELKKDLPGFLFRELIALAQTLVSCEAGSALSEIIADQDDVPSYAWAHFFGWLLATCVPKPMSIITSITTGQPLLRPGIYIFNNN